MKIKPLLSIIIIFLLSGASLYALEESSVTEEGRGDIQVREFSEALARRSGDIKDISFKFRQKIFIGGSTDTVKARVYHMRPHYFFISYSEPVVQEIYYDGSKLITYLPRIMQATSREKESLSGFLGITPEIIYSERGLDFIIEDHAIDIYEDTPGEGEITLKARPFNTGDYRELKIIFDSGTLKPLRTRVTAPHSSALTFFEEYNINSGLEKDRFRFTPPSGVNIIEMD